LSFISVDLNFFKTGEFDSFWIGENLECSFGEGMKICLEGEGEVLLYLTLAL